MKTLSIVTCLVIAMMPGATAEANTAGIPACKTDIGLEDPGVECWSGEREGEGCRLFTTNILFMESTCFTESASQSSREDLGMGADCIDIKVTGSADGCVAIVVAGEARGDGFAVAGVGTATATGTALVGSGETHGNAAFTIYGCAYGSHFEEAFFTNEGGCT